MSTSKIFITFLIFAIFNFAIYVESVAPEQCGMDSGECVNKSKAFPLKIIAIACILATSMVGVCLPLITSSVVAFKPDHDLFVIVKSFSAGIILGTGFMHVLPDSFDMLGSPCLPDHPWHKFPFTGLVAMFSAILTLMVDSLGSSLYSQRNNSAVINKSTDGADQETLTSTGGHSHNGLHNVTNEGSEGSQLLRYRIVAMVLEFGIIVHSVVIGLSLGASNNTCTIKSLLAALCFHQMFEGMGLGGCILQAEYNFVKKAAMAFFFAVTTPFGIALGMALSTSYRENSPIALVVIGLLNGSSAGLLIYMALVDLLATDFMGPKLQSNIKLQIKSFIAVMLGAGGMSVMAIWA